MLSPNSERRNLLKGLAFLSPWLIGFLAFTVIPIGMSARLSFCDYSLLQPPVYRGLENYRTMFEDPVFWKALQVTFYYALVALPLGMLLALSLALLLNTKVSGLSIYRTLIFLPSLVPAVASGMLWQWLLNEKLGLINLALSHMGIAHPPGWLAIPEWAMPAMILMSFWGVGNTVIIYLAGLQDVPAELYEAADLDGATPFQQIIHVTLPSISPVIFFNLVMAIIGSMQSFTAPAIVFGTGGGVDRSALFYTLHLYSTAFENLKMGEASAMAWVQLFIVLSLTALAFWSSKKWVHYQGK